MRGTASSLGIPEQNIDNHLVRSFVELSTDLQDLHTRLSGAQARTGGLGVQLESGDLDPSLEERYGRAAELVAAAMALLHDGLPKRGGVARPEYLKRHLDDALVCYGLEVRDADPDSSVQQMIRRAGRYRGRPLSPSDPTD